MATKTYLQLINKTLMLLRENQVGAVGASDYANLCGEYVNEAKERVEGAWKWQSLQVTYTIPITAGQRTYLINSSTAPGASRYPDERSYLMRDKRNQPLVFDSSIPTNTYPLREFTAVGGIYNDYPGAGATFTNIPSGFYYTPGQTPSITLTQTPPAGRTITVRMVVPQDEFTLGTEVLLVPWRPVSTLAYALANDERGEDLGQDGNLLFAKASDELARAISFDIDSDDFEMVAD